MMHSKDTDERSAMLHSVSRALSDPASGPSVLEARVAQTDVHSSQKLDLALDKLKGEVSPKARTAAVVLAGGKGERFGLRGGKQLFKLIDRPVVTWALEAFDATADIGQIVLVCPEEDFEHFCHEALDPYPFVTPITLAPASSLRQGSAFSGVNTVDEGYDLIMMHDGARPLVTPELITHTINVLKGIPDAAGAVVGHPAIDTLKVVRGNHIVSTPDRSAFWVAQTPQVFRSDILRYAHSAALRDGFVGTDDSSLVERLGHQVLLINGPRDNIKLTMPEDISPVQAALQARRGLGGVL